MLTDIGLGTRPLKRKRRFLTLDEVTETTPLTLANAAEIAFPGCGIRASTLRLERDRGRLAVFRLGGRDYTTLKAIEDLKALSVVGKTPPGRPPEATPQPTSQDAFMEKLRLRREADRLAREEERARRKTEREALKRSEHLEETGGRPTEVRPFTCRWTDLRRGTEFDVLLRDFLLEALRRRA